MTPKTPTPSSLRPVLGRLLTAALALAVALVAGCGEGDGTETLELPPKRFDAAVPDGFFGINGQRLLPMAIGGRLDALDRHLDQIDAGGIEFIRVRADWTAIEPRPPEGGEHAYEFAAQDAWMRALAEHELNWQLVVNGVPAPEWARDPDAATTCGFRAAPARVSDVVALSAALARRYGEGGTFWRRNPDLPRRPVTEYEIWNEPNFGSFWCPDPDPDAYAELLADAADAIHAIDPEAKVLFGGLAGWKNTVAATDRATAHTSVPDFLRGVLAARPEIAEEIDAVAVHAYQPRPGEALTDIAWYRDVLRAVGLGELPMVVNESGWYTHGIDRGNPSTPETDRAAYFIALANLIGQTNCRISGFAPYTWITNEHNLATVEDWFGIADPTSGEPYASGEAYISQVLLFTGRGDVPPPRETKELCG